MIFLSPLLAVIIILFLPNSPYSSLILEPTLVLIISLLPGVGAPSPKQTCWEIIVFISMFISGDLPSFFAAFGASSRQRRPRGWVSGSNPKHTCWAKRLFSNHPPEFSLNFLSVFLLISEPTLIKSGQVYSGLGSWDSFQGFSLARFGPGVRLRAEVQGFVLGSVWVSGPEQHCFNIFHVLMVVTAPGGPLGPAESLAPPKPDTLPPPPPPPTVRTPSTSLTCSWSSPPGSRSACPCKG